MMMHWMHSTYFCIITSAIEGKMIALDNLDLESTFEREILLQL